MNKLKYIVAIFFAATLTSCFDDAPGLTEQIASGDNVLGFVNRTGSVSGIADGSEYEFFFPVAIVGPSTDDLSGTYTATVTVDPSSTAVEGTHFRLEETTITLTEASGYKGLFKVTMLTEGIETPLEKNPELVLRVSNVQGSGKIIASGAKLSINMLFLCPSDLAGAYTVTVEREGGGAYVFDEVLTETGPGQYRGLNVGHWGPNGLGVGDAGFDFFDVCGVITVPNQNLANYYSNQVFQAGESSVDEETGTIRIVYAITFAAWPDGRKYTYTYVRK